jgi:hypothetical protein
MKNTRIIVIAGLLSVLLAGCSKTKPGEELSEYTGVWAGKNSELVQTTKYTLLFNRHKMEITAMLRKVAERQGNLYSDFIEGYVFDVTEKSYKPVNPEDIQQSVLFKKLFNPTDEGLQVTLNSQSRVLKQIEDIFVCAPYEMPVARMGKIGECLKYWQLGTTVHKLSPENLLITIGTNKHLYIFQSGEDILYCRAARIRHNEKGSVFSQNIRLMFNSSHNEQTVYMVGNNLKKAQKEIQINNNLFKPNICSFEKGGIYWSLKSWQPDTIRLNGCGEVYTYTRPQMSDEKRVEWFSGKSY